MASLTDYRLLKTADNGGVLDSASGAGGEAINEDLKILANAVRPVDGEAFRIDDDEDVTWGSAAVDLQRTRTEDSQSASGNYSAIGGGRDNTASSYCATVGGGKNNTAANADQYGYPTIGGGYGNTAGEDNATVGGGCVNSVTANNSTVGGGYSNSVSGTNSTIAGGNDNGITGAYASIGGGLENTIGGAYGVIGGGRSNEAGGLFSVVGGGYENDASGASATVAGGRQNEASGDYSSVLGGRLAKADKYGQVAHAASCFASKGDAQTSKFVVREDITHDDANWHTLFLDGSSAEMTIATDTVWTFDCLLVGTTAGCAKSFGFAINGVIENDGGTTTMLASNVTTIYEDDSDFDAQAVADDTNDSLRIQVKDSTSGGDTVRWVAVVRTAEVTYGAA